MVFRGISLVMAATVGLLAVGVIVAIALLLSSERGRTVLKTLLIVPAVLLVAALLTLFSWRAASFARYQTETRKLAQRQAAIQEARFREVLARETARIGETISRLGDADPQVYEELAEAHDRVR